MENNFIMISIFLFLCFIPDTSFSFECFPDCQTCSEESNDINDMKCLSCKDEDYSLLYNTTNCVYKNEYKTYFNNETNNINYLYPCSLYENTNCYECDPNMQSNTRGICISCNPGYQLSRAKKCIKCSDEYIKYVISDFDNCYQQMYITDLQFCDKYITICTNIPISSDIDCPDAVPIFNSIEKICTDMDCPEEGFENGTCIIKKEKYKVRKFFIHWFNDTYIQYPSFNIDKSGYLLVEFSIADHFKLHQLHNQDFPKRKLFFLDDEGRGSFDKFNDISEKIITYDSNSYRFLSVSSAIKVNNESEYSFLLNYEQSQGLLELINIKTGEASYKYINTLLKGYRNIIFEESFWHNAQIFLIELNDNNNSYLLGFLEKETKSLNVEKGLTLVKFNFTSNDDKIDINSLTIIFFFHLHFDIGDSRISVVEGKNNNIFFEYMNMEYYIEVLAYNFNYDINTKEIKLISGFKLDIFFIINYAF